jgi:hypothetical protein
MQVAVCGAHGRHGFAWFSPAFVPCRTNWNAPVSGVGAEKQVETKNCSQEGDLGVGFTAEIAYNQAY